MKILLASVSLLGLHCGTGSVRRGEGASITALAKRPAMLFVGQLLVETGVGIAFRKKRKR